jgi:hypothetical protein
MTKEGDTTRQVNVDIGSDISKEIEEESDRKVLTRKDNDVQVAVLMRASSSSDGELKIVEDNGQVQAKMDSDTKVIMRSYVDGRSEDDDGEQEKLIKNGATIADIDIAQDSSGGLRVASQPYYSAVTIDDEVASSGSSSASKTFTVNNIGDEGQHVICKLDNTFDSVTNVRVDVDGSAATKVDSYDDLDGKEDVFLVKSRSNGRIDLLVQFSSTSGSSAGYHTASSSRNVTVDSNSSGRLSATSFKLYALGGIAALVLAAAPM